MVLCIHPKVRVVRRRLEPDEVRSADARAALRDVRMVDVESGVHHADGHGLPACAGEDARRSAVDAQRVGTHRGHRGVVGGLDDPDRLHRENEVGRRQSVQPVARDRCRVDTDGGVVAADHGTPSLQFAPPSAVGVVRHQGDEDRYGTFVGEFHRRVVERAELRLRRHRAQTVHRRQGGDGTKAAFVSRQPDAEQAPRRPDDLRTGVLERRRDIGTPRIVRQSYPPEGPAPPGRRRLGRQIPDRRIQPVQLVARGPVAPAPVHDGCLGHFAVEADDRQAVRQRRCSLGFHRPRVGVPERRQRCRLHDSRLCRAPAFLRYPRGGLEEDSVQRRLRGRYAVGAAENAREVDDEDPHDHSQRCHDGHTYESLREEGHGRTLQPRPSRLRHHRAVGPGVKPLCQYGDAHVVAFAGRGQSPWKGVSPSGSRGGIPGFGRR